MPYSTRIIDRGRGPEIEGTRITVYDILDYHTKGHHDSYIASVLNISSEQVRSAVRYIEEHKDAVMPEYQEMLEFAARGNPPHIRAILEESHRKLMARKRELEERNTPRGNAQGGGDARAAG